MTQVGIIGGGITGLTAAFELRRAGCSVTVYERSSQTGGVIRSFRDGPWLAEGGPNTLLETDPFLSELVAELGLESRRLDSDPQASARFVVRGGRPVELPSSVFRFLGSRLFSLKAKVRLLSEPFRRPGHDDESVADFVRRRLGDEFLDYAVDPLVTGIYAGDPAALSVRHAFPRMHALEARYGSLIRGQIFGARERRRRGEISKASARKFSFDDGLQMLPDALHGRLRDSVLLEALVEEVQCTGGTWRIVCRHLDAQRIFDHQAVLFCGTAHSLARLTITAPDVPSLRVLSDIPYPPVASVVLGFRRGDVGDPCHGFGVLIPHREGFGILGTIFSSDLFPKRAPADHVTLTTYVGGARRPEAAQLPDSAVMDLVRRELRRLLGVRGAPVFEHLSRWPHAIPQYNVGYQRFLDLLDDLETRAPGFHVAGHFRDGVALSDSILAGRRAARRISERLNAAQHASVAEAPACMGIPP